jgi:hypothetical protein
MADVHPWTVEWEDLISRWVRRYEQLDPGIQRTAEAIQQGAVDLHVHCDPSVLMRSVDAFEAAAEASAAGFRAIVIKDHHTSTEAQAWLAQRHAGVREPFEVFGSTWLNNHVGGYNVYAVDRALTFGARMISCPTVSASADVRYRDASGHGHTHPPDPKYLKAEQLRESLRPVETLDSDGNVRPEVIDVLDMIAAAGNVVLGTGHLGAEEIWKVVPTAVERGVNRINMTHLQHFTTVTPRDIHEFCQQTGAYVEYTTVVMMYLGDGLADALRTVGPEHITYATDAGFAPMPKPVDFHLYGIGHMLAAGFTEDEVARMVRQNPAELLGVS